MLQRNLLGDPSLTSEVLRDWFSKLEFSDVRPYANHTHGDAASKRTIGSNFIAELARITGKPAVYFQGSASDLRKGRSIERDWYWAKDLGIPLSRRPPSMTKESLTPLAMVDVDEHVDNLEHMLSVDPRPYLLYTFVPSAAAKDKGDYTYRFMQDGSVEYVVAGGGIYHHKLWDFSHDSIMVEGYEFDLQCALLGCVAIKHTAFYKVERRNVDVDHQVILLVPMKRWSSPVSLFTWVIPFAKIAADTISAPRLTRLNPVVGEYVRVQVMTQKGLAVSTAGVGQFSCVTVPIAVDEEARFKHALTKEKLSVAMTKASMSAAGGDVNGAEILTAFHREQGVTKQPTVFNTHDGVRTYQFLPKLADLDPEVLPSMDSFMKPLFDNAFAPSRSKGNDLRAVSKRVLEVKSAAKLTPFLRDMVQQFVKLLQLNVNQFPVDEDEVYRRQSKPTQRVILENANYSSSTGHADVFMKRECYPKVGDPRMITTIDGADKKGYSAFIYALYDVIKLLPWFCSGMKPIDVSKRVASIAENSLWLAETDFSRMDGRVSVVLRFLEEEMMRTFFHPSLHEQMMKLMHSQTWLKCRSKFGVSYNSQYARASGSPETTVFNTVAACFVIFLAFVLQGKAPAQAYEKVVCSGAFQGDDGLNADLKISCAEEAAKMVGQKLEVKIVPRGELVTFLARYYGPNVWFGETDSCCDIRRQLGKFHTAVRVENDVRARQIKLREKAFAFWLTDENTPVLGKFVKRVLDLSPVHHEKTEGTGEVYKNILGIWNSDIEKEFQFESRKDDLGWKRQLLEKQIPEYSIVDFETWIDSCKTLEDLMSAPNFARGDPVHPGGDEHVVVDNDIIPPPERKTKTRRGTRGSRGNQKPLKRNSANADKAYRKRKPAPKGACQKDKSQT